MGNRNSSKQKLNSNNQSPNKLQLSRANVFTLINGYTREFFGRLIPTDPFNVIYKFYIYSQSAEIVIFNIYNNPNFLCVLQPKFDNNLLWIQNNPVAFNSKQYNASSLRYFYDPIYASNINIHYISLHFKIQCYKNNITDPMIIIKCGTSRKWLLDDISSSYCYGIVFDKNDVNKIFQRRLPTLKIYGVGDLSGKGIISGYRSVFSEKDQCIYTYFSLDTKTHILQLKFANKDTKPQKWIEYWSKHTDIDWEYRDRRNIIYSQVCLIEDNTKLFIADTQCIREGKRRKYRTSFSEFNIKKKKWKKLSFGKNYFNGIKINSNLCWDSLNKYVYYCCDDGSINYYAMVPNVHITLSYNDKDELKNAKRNTLWLYNDILYVATLKSQCIIVQHCDLRFRKWKYNPELTNKLSSIF